ncbi:MAG TPA: energy transducer TonB [Burkholderiales bacterium]|nr:energy transducer TonB [Burkholderiales bacterium]
MWYPDPVAARLHYDRQMRMLYACLGASMALHAAAIFWFPTGQPAFRPDETRELTALFAAQPEPAAVAPAPRKPPARQEAEVQTPLPRPQEPAPVAAPSAPEPAAAPAAAPDESPVAASAPAQVRAEVPAKPADVLDPSLLDAYRRALRDAADRYQRYPVQARQQGWEGRVEIRVIVDANGTMKSALVKSPSRYRILDEQALDMVKKAFKALAQSRPAPRGREFTVDIPVVFELQTG